MFETECTFLSSLGCQFQESELLLLDSFGNTCLWLWLEIGTEILILLSFGKSLKEDSGNLS